MTEQVIISLSISLTAIFAWAIIAGWGLVPVVPIAGVIALGAAVFGRASD
jgi:hypothetical protein